MLDAVLFHILLLKTDKALRVAGSLMAQLIYISHYPYIDNQNSLMD